MDKIIATVFLVIGAVTGSLMLISGLLPSISQSADSLRETHISVAKQINSDITIILAVQDPDNSDSLIVWVKNVGGTTIENIENTDLFVRTPQGMQFLSYGTDSADNTWSYCMEGTSQCSSSPSWKPSVTMKATITMNGLVSGHYNILLVLPIGVQDHKDFIL